MHQPSERDRRLRRAISFSHLIKCSQYFLPALVEIRLHALPTRRFRKVLFIAVLARQETASERDVRNNSQVLFHAELLKLALELRAVVQVVVRLE